jgi:hypothetical protein
MTGRHRKPSPSAGLQLSRVGVFAVLATAPLVAVGTASASPAAGSDHTPEKRSHSHDSDHGVSDRGSDDNDSEGDDSGGSSRHRGRSQSAGHSRTHYLDLAEDRDDDSSIIPGRSRSRSGSNSGTTQATDAQWDRLAECESSRNWDANTGNGYKGGLQFNDSTWRAYGGNVYAPSADQASREEQIAVGKKVQRQQGWRAWPSCGSRLGGA